MRTVLMVIATACISATGLGAEDPLARKLSLKWDRTPIKQVLKDLSEKTGLRFVYSETRIAKAGPVSLEVKNQPVSRVLRSVLRARGLEVVLSKQGLAALVDANGDIGSAKSFGRALRTFVRLEKKLEGAKQLRDEINVPGWTGDDDRELAEALIDFSGTILYFAEQRGRRPDDIDVAERMAASYDPDVRAGTVSLFFANLGGKRSDPRVKALFGKMLADTDPLARGCAIFSAFQFLRNDLERLGSILKKAARSAHPEERFAAALACAVQSACRRPRSIPAAVFQKDKSAAVRAMGYVALISDFSKKSLERGEAAAATGKALQDDNPIVRTLGLGVAVVNARRNPAAMEGAAGYIKASADPWLKTVLSLITSTMKGKGLEGFNSARQLMSSEKTSKQLLGCAATAFLATMLRKTETRKPGTNRPKPELGKLPELLDAKNLWVRSTALLVCSALDAEKTAPRLVTELKGDEVARYSGLLACMFGRKGLSPELRTALLANNGRVPSHAEAILVSEIVRSKFQPDEIAATMIDMIKRNPTSPQLRQLISATRYGRGFSGKGGHKLKMKVVEAVLAARRPELEMTLVKQWGRHWSWGPENSDIVLRLLRDGHLETLAELIRQYAFRSLKKAGRKEALDLVRERLRNAADSGSQASRCTALRAMAALMSKSIYSYPHDRKSGERISTVREMLDSALKGKAEVGGAGIELLSATLRSDLFKDSKGRQTFPEFLQGGCVAVLKLIDHPISGESSRALLRQLIDGQTSVFIAGMGSHRIVGSSVNGKPPLITKKYNRALLDAIAGAQKKVLGSAPVNDRVLLRVSLARTGDAESVKWLAAQCIAGKVPTELRTDAMSAVAGQTRLAPRDFIEWLLARTTDVKENAEFITSAFGLLIYHDGLQPHLTTAAEKLLAGSTPGHRDSYLIAHLTTMATAAATSARKTGKPRPAWLARAAKIGLRMAGNKQAQSQMRSHGARLAASALAGREIESMVQDEKTDLILRTVLAEQLDVSSPQSTAYEKFLPKYDALPKQLRKALAMSAAKSPKAPKAEAFVLRALGDKKLDLRTERDSILQALNLPPSPQLLETVKALKAKGAFWARHALRKLKAGGGKRPPPKQPDPPEVF
jgi:hypothetical protein